MKTVLWISRHAMTEPQLRDLARVLGDTVQVLPYTQTVKQADVLRPLIEQAGCNRRRTAGGTARRAGNARGRTPGAAVGRRTQVHRPHAASG